MNRHGVAATVAAMALALVVGSVLPSVADNELSVAQPTFYVIGPGNDAGIAPIAQAVATRLQSLFDATAGPGNVWVIPRLGWSPDDLYNQCANDPTKKGPGGPKIIGGMILDGTNSYVSGVNSYVLWTRNWAKLSTHAQLVSCTPAGFTAPTITWASNDLNGYGARNGFPIETGAAGALYFGSSANGNARYIALGATISGLESTTAIPPVDATDSTRDAAGRVANDLIEKLTKSCNPPSITIAQMCAKLGLAPPLPLVTPQQAPGAAPSATPPTPKPKETPVPRPRPTPT